MGWVWAFTVTLESSLRARVCIPSGPGALPKISQEIPTSTLFQYRELLCSLNPALVLGTKPCDTSPSLLGPSLLSGAEFRPSPSQICVPLPSYLPKHICRALGAALLPRARCSPCSRWASSDPELCICYLCYCPGCCSVQSRRVKGTVGVPLISGTNYCWLIPFVCTCNYGEESWSGKYLLRVESRHR